MELKGLGSGPPPIVSLDEMVRAESAEKKRKRKARPAGKKVGWADRAGKILQVVKEFHSDDAPQAVSETPQESPAEVAAAMAHHHGDHKHWAERVKREREMERKFHGKGGGGGGRGESSSKGKNRSSSSSVAAAGGGGGGSGGGGEEALLSSPSLPPPPPPVARKKPMVTTVVWRRPGPYEEGVVHEDVMLLEVDSSEAEGQGARTRAGLEQVGAQRWLVGGGGG